MGTQCTICGQHPMRGFGCGGKMTLIACILEERPLRPLVAQGLSRGRRPLSPVPEDHADHHHRLPDEPDVGPGGAARTTALRAMASIKRGPPCQRPGPASAADVGSQCGGTRFHDSLVKCCDGRPTWSRFRARRIQTASPRPGRNALRPAVPGRPACCPRPARSF
jgi:hypothetical protein